MTNREELYELQVQGYEGLQPGNGGSLQEALDKFGVHAEVDEFFPKDELGDLCANLNLTYYGPGATFNLPSETKAIVIYQTEDEKIIHAECCTLEAAKESGWIEKLAGLIVQEG